MGKKILMVVTNHTDMQEGKKTGIWLSEFAEAYMAFQENGYEITVASPKGGTSPIDPGSVGDQTPQEILDASKHLENTKKLDDVMAEGFEGIFLPGGHGTMFDLPDNQKLQQLLREFYEAGKIVAAVCHGPAGLVGATLSNGQPLVAGKRVNAFTDREEEATGLGSYLPFLLESKIRDLGAIFVAAPNWSTHVEVDGNLITGQNPQSTLAVTDAVLSKLGE
ncbi:type 1 glutamine amidotransferase domain-containing protein [Paenibacillus glucanolyticus]|jgi:putative intracellular protease/amidase|uniref:type 1 glutamine amidotransferase domain-containing protein n=1 Tax=Paenibacillus TaxID=44249 RepID=UPI0003E2B7A3|nr:MULTISPECIES: type 1 glutamine amidotransferase domain-containing protein [Paenibacillus]ANA80106.1 glutamine amidotransferase [Paenibacillus glucanolyticus]AVV55871.1 type 1 glutamine amidotransferase domain-containing protein [Paenibacillus glucanolyticus]AWP30401.1 glutamine amidotransferase [Paenibacillus sp. Cedars]ETT38499.1 peptidase C56 family protein [Paenibacillus sp. FSL R5-808]MPY19324.1 type 1 glutamine amidotransferase domain-containing protein [Paenibacillus glucanolyticus]